MANHEVRDRLQPVLLDRLTDLNPHSRVESDESRVMNKAQIREAVLRDLSWLLNAVKPMPRLSEQYPLAGESVINFGLPPMSGQLASRIDIPLHHVTAAYVRSHFDAMEVGLSDGPRPDEILFCLAMSCGPRIHDRMGGLAVGDIKAWDGLR
jgi:hypothetical protein